MDSQPLLDAFTGLSLDMDEHRGPEYYGVPDDEELDGPVNVWCCNLSSSTSCLPVVVPISNV